MLLELSHLYVLFEDDEETKVLWMDHDRVVAAAVHGRMLAQYRDYWVFSRTPDGWEAMRETALRQNISRSATDALVVDSIDDLQQWVEKGPDSHICAYHPDQPQSCKAAADSGSSALEFDEPLDLSSLPEVDTGDGACHDCRPHYGRDESDSSKPFTPRNRLTRYFGQQE
jgi:hypothetical protein